MLAPKINVFSGIAFMPKASSSAARASAPPASYEAALQELGQLESGQMPPEQLPGGYRRGARLRDETSLNPWAQV
jgi:exonuclease VII small subunit